MYTSMNEWGTRRPEGMPLNTKKAAFVSHTGGRCALSPSLDGGGGFNEIILYV